MLDRSLNAAQYEAATAPDGLVIVIAGAGSGKTKTLANRIVHIIESGVDPTEIVAVTFTRRAAEEMRRRVASLVGRDHPIRIGTFHAIMARTLRSLDRADLAPTGRTPNFTIWDEDDLTSAIRRVAKAKGLDRNELDDVIDLMTALRNGQRPPIDPRLRDLVTMIAADVDALRRSANAFDFDDLIRVPIELLTTNDALRQRIVSRIRHLLVDEFQDVSDDQMRLVEVLSSVHGNLFVVGDDAQSIYRFRGASPHYLLALCQRPGATVITLTTNYRSTQAICDVANAVLRQSRENRYKRLVAASGEPGERPVVRLFRSAEDEAAEVVRFIVRSISNGERPEAIAILVRTNMQTRLFEEELARAGVRYRVLGGPAFWARREVRDLVAYLRFVKNPNDHEALRRLLDRPKRGIGNGLIAAIETEAIKTDGDRLDAARRVVRSEAGTRRGRDALAALVDRFDSWRAAIDRDPGVLVERVLIESGLRSFYNDGTDDGAARVANLDEVVAAASRAPSLDVFLEDIALDADRIDADPAHAVTIATIHAAKGLEWRTVIIAGCEEGLLPHQRSVTQWDIEEERRLFYVGVTRAQRRCVLTAARERGVGRIHQTNALSRFIREAQHVLTIERIVRGAPSFPSHRQRHSPWAAIQ
jgi:DNA helicase-2/ATP-dependent DNA helicase PcrA